MAQPDWKLGGTLIETSAIDPFLAEAFLDVPGPFVVSTYALSEKAYLPWDEYRARVLGLEKKGVQFLEGPPLMALLDRSVTPGDGFRLVPMNVGMFLDGRRVARDALETIKVEMTQRLPTPLGKFRSAKEDWIERHRNGELELDPANHGHIPEALRVIGIDKLGGIPADAGDAGSHFEWHLTVWQWALAFLRSEERTTRAKQFRNDPIDATHYALAATFCDRIVTCDRDMEVIHGLLPEPRGDLRYLTQ